MELKKFIREIQDFPKAGVLFRDLTPLLRDPDAFRLAVDRMAADCEDVDLVCGIDARGFILGAPVALKLGVGFVPLRKGGKLPGDVETTVYSLEYGLESLELQQGSIDAGQRVLIVDDILATGGTTQAAAELVERSQGKVAAFTFLIELCALGGRKKLEPAEIRALISYTD